MDDRFSILSQQVFNKTLPEFSVDELVAITDQNPYFTAAQILLLKKLEKGSEAYNSQYQKAILYYHDPVAFDYLVHRADFETEYSGVTESPVEETIADNTQEYEHIESSDFRAPVIEIADNRSSDDVQNYMDEMRSGTSAERDHVINVKHTEQILKDETTIEHPIDKKIETEEHSHLETPEIISEPLEPVEELETGDQESHALSREQFPEETQPTEQVLEIRDDSPTHIPQKEFPLACEQKTPELDIENVFENQPTLPALKEEKETDLVFEPFHTVDYFASQGIKISQEEVPKDKFGKQLKSFTEWLKTMKRLPAAEIASSVEKSSEQKIENLAADSVNSADVVTEAMAEVWLRQGNQQKAIEIYNKLILLNPSKSAYFAAKIDSLKKSS